MSDLLTCYEISLITVSLIKKGYLG